VQAKKLLARPSELVVKMALRNTLDEFLLADP